MDLSVDALDYRGGTIRRLRTTLALAGTGGLTVEQARAILPGQTSVDFTGALAGRGADALLQGDLKVVSDNLSTLLAWSGLQPGLEQAALAAGRLRTLSLASRVALDGSTLRFTEAELRVDASRLSGSLALSLGARPQVAGVLALDRLDLDAYLPDGRLPQLAGQGLQAFGAFDAALEARIDRLTWHGLRFQDISLNGRSVAGRLTLGDLSLHDAAETDAHLSGELDLGQRTFDLAGTLQSGRPVQLLRSLGMAPPLLLARLAPISVQAGAKGKLDAFDLDLELRHDQASLALKGAVQKLDGQPTYALTVDAGDPDYPKLLDQVGIAAAPEAAEPAPVSITGKLTGDLSGQTTMVGTARLGAMSLTGEVGFQPERPRPKLRIRLSAGEPSAVGLASLAALAGVQPARIVTEGPRPGAWSSQPLAFGWLGAIDADVELNAKGGLAGPGFELQARLDQGRLMIDQLSVALWNGQLKVQTSVDAARPLPYLGLAIDLREADAAALTAWLDLPPVVQGKADLYVEATTAGDNLRDLIRGLIGDAKVTLHDGRLVGLDLGEARLGRRRHRLRSGPRGRARRPGAEPERQLRPQARHRDRQGRAAGAGWSPGQARGFGRPAALGGRSDLPPGCRGRRWRSRARAEAGRPARSAADPPAPAARADPAGAGALTTAPRRPPSRGPVRGQAPAIMTSRRARAIRCAAWSDGRRCRMGSCRPSWRPAR